MLMMALAFLKINVIRYLMPLNDLMLAEIAALAVMVQSYRLLYVSSNGMAKKSLLQIHV